MDDQNKNLILATALSFLVIMVWFLIFPPEEQIAPPATQTAETSQGSGAAEQIAPAPGTSLVPVTPTESREAALATAERITIDTPKLKGTLSLTGGRIDDLFRREVSLDDDYMFSITQSVENTSDTARKLQPYGIVARHGEPDVVGFFILHEGMVGMADGELTEIDYNDMPELDVIAREASNAELTEVTQNGWVGFTDKNWMTTLIPTPGTPFTSVTKYVPQADIYQTEARQLTMSVAPGETATSESSLFAGAKEWESIRNYERSGIKGFIDSIDWGWFFFLTKPIFAVLHWLNVLIGNMGWSIIVLTLLIKAVLLPLAYKSYVSMAKMKELQPEMEKLKESAGDDRQKLQQKSRSSSRSIR